MSTFEKNAHLPGGLPPATRAPRVALIAAISAAAALATAACVDTATTTCAGDWRCPPGTLCVDNQDGTARCKPPEPICGDGYADGDEVCDDGNMVDGDGCNNDCRLQCGDGIVQDDEMCDPMRPLGDACLELGFDMGTLSCASSCKDVSTKSCIDFDWQPMTGVPADWHFLRTWVFSSEDVWAVGIEGALSQYPALDVCADCGHVFRYDGKEWRVALDSVPLLLGLWASGPEDIHVVGVFGNVWRFDGSTWSKIDVDTDHHLTAIWGSGPDNMFAVGMYWEPRWDLNLDTATFSVLRYDGNTWAPMDLSLAPAVPRSWLYSVWGSGPTDVFAVGTRGTILHYDGNAQGQWTSMAVETTTGAQLVGVWGTGADNVVAVGEDGTILRYDGERWALMETPGRLGLTGIWADDKQRFYAVGAQGTVLRLDPSVGSEWIELASGASWDLLHIHGSSPDNVLAVGQGGTVLRKGGEGWTAMDLQGNEKPVEGVWGSDLDCIYAVTSEGEVWHYDGNPYLRWSPMGVGAEHALRSVYGVGCGDPFAVGTGGTVLHYADGVWSRMSSSTDTAIHDIWMVDPNDVFAVGSQGMILRYDGNAQGRWEPMASGVDDTLTSVWGTSASNVFAVGNHGTILHYNGNPGGQWSTMSSGTSGKLYGVWGSGPEDVFAVGEGGLVLRYDGDVWTRMNSPMSVGYLRAVWGRSASDVFAGGQNGTLYHYDGVHWSRMSSPTTDTITSIWGTPDGKYLLLGDRRNITGDERGRIFRLMRPRP